MLKELPVGVENFKDLQNYYYVDKTLFLRELIDGYFGKSVLVTRPRRFGKSAIVSMVEHFFDIEKKESGPLFADKNIASHATAMQHQNKYPVIRINMKNVNGLSAKEIIDKAIGFISLIYREHAFLLDDPKLFDIEKEEFLAVTNRRIAEPYFYQSAIQKLSYLLSRHYKSKVIILIDEYDAPIQAAYESSCYDECMAFFKELYSSALKSNDSLCFALVTGIMEISKESLFSGLNNLSVNSVIDNRLSAYFGFEEDETKAMLDYYGEGENFDAVKTWYGGYLFGKKTLFNPWSIICFLEKREIRKYWVNTGTNNLLNSLLNEEVVAKLARVVNDQAFEVTLNNSVSFRDLAKDDSAVYSYLVQAGYLNAIYVKEPDRYFLSIPNEEIRNLFGNDIINRKGNPKASALCDRLRNAFASGKVDEISMLLEDYVIGAFSYYDLTNEKQYQVLLTGILSILFDAYVVSSEVNGKTGRCDVMISPKNENHLGIVLEMKYFGYPLTEKRLDAFAHNALGQIKKKQYFAELQRRNCSKVLLYGFAFDQSKKHAIAFEEIA